MLTEQTVVDNFDRINLVNNTTDAGFADVTGADMNTASETGNNLRVLQLTYFTD